MKNTEITYDIPPKVIKTGIPIVDAAKDGNFERCKLLLEQGTNPNVNGNQEAFKWAALRGNLKIIMALLESGSSVNRKDNMFKTALWYSVNRKDSMCKTALWYAVEVSHKKFPSSSEDDSHYEEVITCLLDHGADIDTQDAYGRPLLYCAIKNGNPDICRLLINRGADILYVEKRSFIPEYMGDSFLHTACRFKNLAVARLLLEFLPLEQIRLCNQENFQVQQVWGQLFYPKIDNFRYANVDDFIAYYSGFDRGHFINDVLSFHGYSYKEDETCEVETCEDETCEDETCEEEETQDLTDFKIDLENSNSSDLK